jgi:mono/diheme cytochrome c family protein
MTRSPRCAASLLAGVVLLGVGCMSQRRGEPIAGEFIPSSTEERSGRELFMRSCHQCHPGGMAGLGPAINNKPLPQWLVKTQVRQGLGAMPSFDEEELSDAELEALVEYVSALRSERAEEE